MECLVRTLTPPGATLRRADRLTWEAAEEPICKVVH
jgi:hypothetical protein